MRRVLGKVAIWLGLAGVCFGGPDSGFEGEFYSAAAQSNLGGADGKPFLMEVNFHMQLNIAIEGHLTLKWAAKDRWWRSATFADFRLLEVRNGENLYIVRNAGFTPLRVTELDGLLRVFPAEAGAWQIKKVRQQKLGSVTADCMKVREGRRTHESSDVEVCIDPTTKDVLSDDRKDDDELRREEFADYQAFGEHRYPQRLKLSRDGSVLIDAHVVSLEAASFDESLFASPPGAMARRQCKDMVHPVAIRQPEPAYPRSAAQNHIGGTVIVSLTVQTDGSVSNVQYLERAGHEMDQVTKEIVETWKFKPARCGSEAVVSDIRVEKAFHP